MTTSLSLLGSHPGPFPHSLSPALALSVSKIPEGEAWLHEIRWEGCRMVAFKEDAHVRLMTADMQDWTTRFPAIAEEIRQFPAEDAVLDGVIVVLDHEGKSNPAALQDTLKNAEVEEVKYVLFDIIYAAGIDMRMLPLIDRKTKLAALLNLHTSAQHLHYSDHVTGRGDAFFKHACHIGTKGIVSKHAFSPYHEGRTGEWCSNLCEKRAELLIGGFSLPTHKNRGIGALALGYKTKEGLIYAGKVGTGFSDNEGRYLRDNLQQLKQSACPFLHTPAKIEQEMQWVTPALVAEIAFQSWTKTGVLQHPSFIALQAKKSPSREKPATHTLTSHTTDTLLCCDVPISHPEKMLYPEDHFTKGDVARYYETIASVLLPHVKDRPLSIIRCPQSTAEHCFMQRHMQGDSHFTSLSVEGTDYFSIQDTKGLLTLVQYGVIEIHPWNVQRDHLDKPDRIIWDFDPDTSVPWGKIVESAYALRELLRSLALESFVKTTGGKGLHVVVPITPLYSYETVLLFAKQVGEILKSRFPQRFTLQMSKSARRGRIFIDYLRNGHAATAVSPYSLRARKGAPVATPLAWEELMHIASPSDFTLTTLKARVMKNGDPWLAMLSLEQTLDVSLLEGNARRS